MSFYTSLSGLKNAQTDLGVISHNIANAETNGFKRSDTQFADLVASNSFTDPRRVRGIGAVVAGITQNFAIGQIEQTGRATDLAISGDGFFALRAVENGNTVYSRNGTLSIDEGGHMVDAAGNRLQMLPVDAAGNVTSTDATVDAVIPNTNTDGSQIVSVTIGENGGIRAAYADGSITTVGRVALASFVAPAGLRQIGSSNWEATGISGAAELGSPNTQGYGKLLAGALERSNVDLAEEMVSLITAQRNFQANAKAIDTSTQLSQTILNLRS